MSLPNKIKIILCNLAILSWLCFVPNASAEIEYGPQNFCTGWTLCDGTEPAAPGHLTCQTNIYKVGSGSLLVSRDNMCFKTLSTPLKGIVEFTAWALPARDSNTNFTIRLGNSNRGRESIYISVNETNRWFYSSPGFGFNYAAPYSMDWTKVRILINTNGSNYSLWLDDNLVAENILSVYSIADGIDSIGLMSGRAYAPHDSYLDDISQNWGDVDENNHFFLVSLFSIAFATADAHTPICLPVMIGDALTFTFYRK